MTDLKETLIGIARAIVDNPDEVTVLETVDKKAVLPIDTYDTASWMAITPLSEQAIKMGGAPVAIPDFTKGKWAMPRKADDLEFALD